MNIAYILTTCWHRISKAILNKIVVQEPLRKGLGKIALTRRDGIKQKGIVEVVEIENYNNGYSKCELITHNFDSIFDEAVKNCVKLVKTDDILWID